MLIRLRLLIDWYITQFIFMMKKHDMMEIWSKNWIFHPAVLGTGMDNHLLAGL